MAKRSKFFRIAVEGATCDGRTLDRNALQEMADTYNPATYQARVNIEHLHGISPEPPFNAQGDVVALKTLEIDLDVGGKTEKRLALYGQVDALDNLVATNAKGQKLFPSIEINPNFAATGKAYLQGLAVTDSPASLGTEILTFAAAQGDKNPFASRKIDKGNFFSAVDVAIDFGFEEGAAGDTPATFFAAAAAFFKQFTDGKAKDEPKGEEKPIIPPEAANDNDKRFAAFGQGIEAMTSGLTAFTTQIDAKLAAFRTQLAAVKTSIETTDGSQKHRPTATGGKNFAQTDC